MFSFVEEHDAALVFELDCIADVPPSPLSGFAGPVGDTNGSDVPSLSSPEAKKKSRLFVGLPARDSPSLERAVGDSGSNDVCGRRRARSPATPRRSDDAVTSRFFISAGGVEDDIGVLIPAAVPINADTLSFAFSSAVGDSAAWGALEAPSLGLGVSPRTCQTFCFGDMVTEVLTSPWFISVSGTGKDGKTHLSPVFFEFQLRLS